MANTVPNEVDVRKTTFGIRSAAFSLSIFCLLAAALVFLVTAIGAKGVPASAGAELLDDLRDFLVTQGGFNSQSAQRAAYFTWLALLWLIAALILLGVRLPLPSVVAIRLRVLVRYGRRSEALALAGLAALWLVEVQRTPSLIWPVPSWALVSGLALLFLFGALSKLRLIRHACLVLLFGLTPLFLIVLLGGLFLPAAMSFWNATLTSMVDMHFALVIGPAERLANGQRLFDDVSPFYGVLPSAIAAGVARMGTELDWVDFYRAIQVLQVFMLVCLAAALIIARNRPVTLCTLVFVVLLPVLMCLPDLFTSYQMTWFPNQTGLRFLGFGIALLALAMLKDSSARMTAFLLGLVLGVLLTYNLETGIAVGAGFAVFAATGALRPRLATLLETAFLLFSGLVISIVTLAALYRLGLGAWPYPEADDMFGFLLRFNQGFGGLPMRDIDAVALLVAAHAAFVILESALIWRRRPLVANRRIRLGVAVVITVWFAYYMNRPQTLNLWTHLYLYAVLLATHWDPRRLALAWSGWRPRLQPALLPAVLLLSLLLQGLAAAATETWSYYENRMAYSSGGGVLVSGVWLRPSVASRLQQQASFVADHPEKENLVYFTPHSFLMPLLTRVHPDLPVRDPFWEVHTPAAMGDLVGRIQRLAPPVILFDDIGSADEEPYGGAYLAALYENLQEALRDDYVLDGREAGWTIWARRADE